MKLGYFQVIVFLLLCIGTNLTAQAQTTTITYQGRLTDTSLPAGGIYNMQFSLYGSLAGNDLIGSPVPISNVNVVNGIFTVNIDFGSTAFAAGANRWLEIGVKKPADSIYTTLNPRQQITSSPYSIRTINAGTADALSSACVTCVADAQISSVAGAKVSGTVSNATSATNATNATNVTGTVGIGNGGTGATTAPNARTNLGLGTLATISPTGTANNTTFLRGDNTWSPIGGSSIQFNRVGVIAAGGNTSYNVVTGVDITGVDMSAGSNFTVHLPPATTAGQIFIIKIEKYNNALLPVLTIQPNGTDKIEGANNLAFGNAGGNRRIYSDGAGNWYTW